MFLEITMADYIVFVWFGILVLALVVEWMTMDLSSIWFSAGAFFSMIVSIFLPEMVWLQVIVFIVGSLGLLLSLRPIFKKYMNRNEIRTNASSLIGQEAVCIKPIVNNEWGEVKIQGKIWTAISNENIEENEHVIVLAITGVKLQVRKKK